MLLGVLVPYCVLLLFLSFLVLFGGIKIGLIIHITATTVYVPILFCIFELKQYVEFLLTNLININNDIRYSKNYFEDLRLFLGVYFIILIGGLVLLLGFLGIMTVFNTCNTFNFNWQFRFPIG